MPFIQKQTNWAASAMISSDTLPTGLLSEETVTCAANSPRLIFQPNYIDLLQTSKRTMQKRPTVRFPWWSTVRTKYSTIQNWNQKETSEPAWIYLTCPDLVDWPRGLPPISRMQPEPGRRWRFRLTHSIFTVCKELRRRVRNTGSDTGCTLCICASIHPDGGGMFPALTA